MTAREAVPAIPSSRKSRLSRRFDGRLIAAFAVFLLAIGGLTACEFRARVRASLSAYFDLLRYNPTAAAPPIRIPGRFIAHAGGALDGLAYTNSLEALDQHYAAGFRLFELDFEWTSDGHLVLVHDWLLASKQFGVRDHVFSHNEFIHAHPLDGFHQLTFEELHAWLLAHPDASIITDTKGSNPRFIRYLSANAADIHAQFILQIYQLSELQDARNFHPRAVWLTEYKFFYPAWALVRARGIDALVVPIDLYTREPSLQSVRGIPVYVHTVHAGAGPGLLARWPQICGVYVD